MVTVNHVRKSQVRLRAQQQKVIGPQTSQLQLHDGQQEKRWQPPRWCLLEAPGGNTEHTGPFVAPANDNSVYSPAILLESLLAPRPRAPRSVKASFPPSFDPPVNRWSQNTLTQGLFVLSACKRSLKDADHNRKGAG